MISGRPRATYTSEKSPYVSDLLQPAARAYADSAPGETAFRASASRMVTLI